jgi:hypothetical protein
MAKPDRVRFLSFIVPSPLIAPCSLFPPPRRRHPHPRNWSNPTHHRRRRAQWDEGEDEQVEVNQRALIDKVLARYAAEFTGPSCPLAAPFLHGS